MSSEPIFHIVLYQPDIPQNTGNIGRTCVAIGAKLWLIRPLGFNLDEKHLRRAGMDYWKHLDYEVVDDWQEITKKIPDRNIWCLTKTAKRLLWDATIEKGDILLFGSESRGLPASILEESPVRNLRLPMTSVVRSLNLASTVNTVAYEGVRQLGDISGLT
jgi:tRNA (cytidine/uridine-2'-O-)-methyltransferase